MTNHSPAHASSPTPYGVNQRVSPTRGGNLARLNLIQPGHFLSQPFEQLVAHGTYLNKVEAASPRPSLWRAGRQNRRSPCAESGTSLPFMHVDHFSHWGISVADTSGDSGRRFA